MRKIIIDLDTIDNNQIEEIIYMLRVAQGKDVRRGKPTTTSSSSSSKFDDVDDE